MYRENSFNTYSVRNPSDGKRLAKACPALADDRALENLNSFPSAFLNLKVNLDIVSDQQRGGLFF